MIRLVQLLVLDNMLDCVASKTSCHAILVGGVDRMVWIVDVRWLRWKRRVVPVAATISLENPHSDAIQPIQAVRAVNFACPGRSVRPT